MKEDKLTGKSKIALQKLLNEKREKLRHLRFEFVQGKLKNVTEMKNIKKDIARILTKINLKVKSQGLKSS